MNYTHIALAFLMAAISTTKACSLSTYSDSTYVKQANTLKAHGKLSEAKKSYQQALALNSKNFDAHLGVAQLYYDEGNLEKAATHFDRAVTLRPKTDRSDALLANSILQLGNNLFNQGKGEKAVAAFKKILTINDNYAAVHHNIAFTLSERLGKFKQSLSYYKRALALKPNNAETHFCFSVACLATGNFKQGWQEYTYRWQRPERAPRKSISLDSWWEGQDISGKTILIRCEQGLGDTLHFIRYAQLLKNRGAVVIAEVQKPLIKLLSLYPYLDQLVAMGNQMPPYDYQIPLLNLPAVFKTTITTIPAQIPYLNADQTLEQQWSKTLQQDTSFKVGICWHGAATHGQVKFMPLNKLAQLTSINGTSFYSLQQLTGLDQLKTLPNRSALHEFGPTFDKTHGSFMDTAAVMKNLDLVITADTSIAHLAGALGIQTWVILPFPAEWRWLINRADSPWYPTVRLFRQKKANKWQPVLEELASALQEQLHAHTS